MGQGNADRFVRSVPQPNLMSAGNGDTGQGFKLAAGGMNLLSSILDLAKANKNDKIAMTKAGNQVTLSYLEKMGQAVKRLDKTDPKRFALEQKVQSLQARAFQHMQNGTDASADSEVDLGLKQAHYDLFESDEAEARPEQMYKQALGKEEGKLTKQRQQEEKRLAQTESANTRKRKAEYDAMVSSTIMRPEQRARGFQAMQGKPQAENVFDAAAIAGSMSGALATKPKVKGVAEAVGPVKFKSSATESEQSTTAKLAALSNTDPKMISQMSYEDQREALYRVEEHLKKREKEDESDKEMRNTKNIKGSATTIATIAPKELKKSIKDYNKLPSKSNDPNVLSKEKVDTRIVSWALENGQLHNILGERIADKIESGEPLTPKEEKTANYKITLFRAEAHREIIEGKRKERELSLTERLLKEREEKLKDESKSGK